MIGGLALLSTLALSQIASHLSRIQIEKDQSALLMGTANQMVSRLSQDMSNRADEILFLTHLDQVRDPNVAPEQKQTLFERVKQAYPHYAWIGITDSQGNILAGTDGLLVGKSVAKRDWFTKGSKGLHFGDAHDAFLLAKIMPKPKWDDLPLRLVDVSAPVLNDAGELLGVICGHLSLDWGFEARAKMLDKLPAQSLDLVVLNHEGRVLMGTPTLPSLAVDLSGLRSFQLISSAKAAPVLESWPDGNTYLTAAVAETPFKDYSGMGWSVMARKSERDAFGPADILSHTINIIGMVTAILFSLLMWFVLRRQLLPLEAVSAAAERIREEDLAVPIPKPTGKDEIAVFARSLTGLVSTLQGRNTELRLTSRVFEESGQGIMITDAQQRILRVNQAFERITGYTSSEATGQSPSLLQSGIHDNDYYRAMWDSITRHGAWSGEIWNRTKEGKTYPEWLNINVLKNDQGEVIHYIGLFDDITEKKEYEKRLVHLANYDVLTNLPNRHLMERHLKAALDRIDSTQSGLALVFIDLDEFKHINDSLGHPAGDMVLREVATRFASEIREEQILARWGGDEFVVVMPDADSIAATHLVKRLIKTLQRPFAIEGGQYHLSMSAGMALFPSDSRHAEGLLRCADTAMFQAKQAGSNLYRFYEGSMNAGVERFLKINSALHRSLDRGGEGLWLAYQPQFSSDGRRVVGIEALLRWEHPELGSTVFQPQYRSNEQRPAIVDRLIRSESGDSCQVSPGDFIPVAEDTGLIIELGYWILEKTMADYASLKASGCLPVPISVNFSVHQLHDHKLVERIDSLTSAYQVPPSHLKIEVTESAIMSDEQTALKVLGKLKSRGHLISIDDFGTGYSCLSYIQKLHPDEIKVDRSFVLRVDQSEDCHNIVSFTLGLATTMGIAVVAEGVETESQFSALKSIGDMRLQGFLFGKPITLEQLKSMLQRV
jgi:diguanylate cyclase (GGDEF)-like protein/PAS domain S-box-containing protein